MPKPFTGKTAVSLGVAPTRAAGRRRLLTSERGLGALGLALAIGSGSFASYMISDGSHQPGVNGTQYLTVFAKLTPSGHGTDRDDADDLPTASVGSTGSQPLLGRYVLRSVSRGTALIESQEGLREVRPGAILPNVGLVTSIERRGGTWVVITEQGIIRQR
jgi:hypothetical protein